MQPPQTMPQPRNVMLSNALRNPQRNDQEENRPQEQYETNEAHEQYRQPNQMSLGSVNPNTAGIMPMQITQPNGFNPNTPFAGGQQSMMPSWVRPQSNSSFNLQPQIPGANQDGMNQGGPMGLQQTQGQNRFGVGLASPRPMPEQLQVR